MRRCQCVFAKHDSSDGYIKELKERMDVLVMRIIRPFCDKEFFSAIEEIRIVDAQIKLYSK